MKLNYLWQGRPGHPLHPPLTDVTIGAYTFATVAAVLSKLSVTEHAAVKGWWLALVVALASSVLTVGAGLVDWLSIERGSALFRSATTHMLVMVAATVFFLLAAVFGHACYVDADMTIGPFLLTLIGFAALSAGGWLGGALTYVYGMRVLSLVDEPAARAADPLATLPTHDPDS